MKQDPFKEYIKQQEPGKRDKGYVWQTAIGLQAVDGLTTSNYLVKTAIKNIEGEITIDEAKNLLDSYYEENSQHDDNDRTEEADKVSVRIAQLLSEHAFSFTPTQYLSIHKNLFEGIYKHAGKMRDYNITKKEWVLDGATVMYGSASELKETLEYDLLQEQKFSYKGLSINDIIQHLAFFVSRLCQIHVFSEGNTRTTAVFLIKYLRILGFDATNDIFAENAWYFRNALVRANYNDIKNGVHETTEYLELFLENLLLGKQHSLNNRTLHISNLLSKNAKQYIEEEKQYIEERKQDIRFEIIFQKEISTNIKSAKTLENIKKLYMKFQGEIVFGRTDIMEELGLTSSPASDLIKKMLTADIIENVKGSGKGKYKFSR